MQCPEGVRDHAGCGDAGFRGRPWGPQENSSLGTALDPKLEAGRPRATPSPRISGGSVRVLVTADTFRGGWTYSRELVSGLVTHGAQVTLDRKSTRLNS